MTDAIHAANLSILATIAPALHERLVAHDKADDGTRPPLSAHETASARQKVADYLRHPLRIQLGPVGATDSPVVTTVRDHIDAFVARRGLEPNVLPGHHRAAVLVLFGLGSGEELRLLMDSIAVRHLVVAEPAIEVLRRSMRHDDWAGWNHTLAARGGSLRIVCAAGLRELAAEAYLALLDCGWTSDGAYYYIQDPALNDCVREFGSRVTAIASAGWFEDEAVMLVNATRNLDRQAASFILNGRPVRKPVPAIIVGAGPSLDKALPHLARLRESAVIFSVGSTIGTLLRHGIVPDFHCEIENKPENYMALRLVADAHDLSALTLLATATVDPRVPGMFGERLLYLRYPGISADIYGDDMHSIAGTSPNCATLAIRMASRFGFSEVYLFGTDFGGRRPDDHHVSDSLWMTDPEWRERYGRLADRFNVPLPANFGGKVYTNRVLFYFLQATQDLIAACNDMTFFNCADGVRIEGATPKAPSAVRLVADAEGRRQALDDIMATADRRGAGELLDRARLVRFHRGFGNWTDRMLAFLDRLQEGNHDLVDWHDQLTGSLWRFGSGNELVGIRTMTWGSLAMMFRHAFHYAIRYDLTQDREYLSAVRDGFDAALRAMRKHVDGVVNALSER